MSGQHNSADGQEAPVQNASTKITGLATWFSKVFASFFSLFKKKKGNHAQEEQGIELQNFAEIELKPDAQTPSEEPKPSTPAEPKPSKIRAFFSSIFSSIANFFSGLFSKKAKSKADVKEDLDTLVNASEQSRLTFQFDSENKLRSVRYQANEDLDEDLGQKFSPNTTFK